MLVGDALTFGCRQPDGSALMVGDEPMNLREWTAATAAGHGGRLFTCGRPGRGTFGRDERPIGVATIDVWAEGLPAAEVVDIVSLLGKKTTGYSEFGYYLFRSSKETGDKPTFQGWLDERYDRCFVVHEFPTVDARGIPPDVLAAVSRCILHLLAQSRTVVVMDSAGAERSARACEAVGYKRTLQR